MANEPEATPAVDVLEYRARSPQGDQIAADRAGTVRWMLLLHVLSPAAVFVAMFATGANRLAAQAHAAVFMLLVACAGVVSVRIGRSCDNTGCLRTRNLLEGIAGAALLVLAGVMYLWRSAGVVDLSKLTTLQRLPATVGLTLLVLVACRHVFHYALLSDWVSGSRRMKRGMRGLGAAKLGVETVWLLICIAALWTAKPDFLVLALGGFLLYLISWIYEAAILIQFRRNLLLQWKTAAGAVAEPAVHGAQAVA